MLLATRIEVATALLQQARSLFNAEGNPPTPIHEQVASALVERAIAVLKS